jgi:hypothetical protein
MSGRARLGLLLVLLGAIAAGGLLAYAKGTSELPVYLTAAERMQAGAPIYRTDDFKPFTYPPFFALPFVPLAALPEAWQRGAWYGVNVALVALAIFVIHRVLQPPRPFWFWAIVGLLSFRHVGAVLENQSHDLVVGAAVTLAAVMPRASPAWSGLAAAMKATPLLFGLLFVVRRRLAAAALLVLVATGATLLPDVVAPQADGRSWVGSWYETFLSPLRPGATADAPGAWNPSTSLNQSLSGTLHRWTSPPRQAGPFIDDVAWLALGDGGRRALTLVASGGVLLLLALACWPRPTAEPRLQHFAAAAAIACGMALLSPMSSKSHFCVLLLPIAFCVRDFLGRRDPVVGTALVLLVLLGPLTSKGIVGKGLGNALLAAGSVTACALIALLATVRSVRCLPPPSAGAPRA